MKLDRFYRNVELKLTRSGKKRYERYSYETLKKLYDVDVSPDGYKTYFINCVVTHAPSKIHKAIEKHFNLV